MKPDYKDKVRVAAYLGKHGYSVPLSVLREDDVYDIKKELLVKPIDMNANFGSLASKARAFKVFKESKDYLYLPRFYGIARYGTPDRFEISKGSDISIDFARPLRDYQEKIVSVYMQHISNTIGNGGILEVPCGRGKTVMALKIISNLRKKTLVIVHKEFLMNQWRERIEEFLPGSRVGRIQGDVFDVEEKDIVLAMLQSVYSKDYGIDAYASFGFTVVDEVHRIGSEHFSKALLRVVTPYMLGISATVKRKDGLTKVLHMFIGDKVYSEERSYSDQVSVRAIHYYSNDKNFNKVELDYRGNIKYATMMKKICAYEPRTQIIARVLRDLLIEDPNKQIMVLCHNKSLLKRIHQYITGWDTSDASTVGYYIGGMKEAALKETESKRIVLATYAMASEALDIKTLSTLFMVTPKTDVEQSVGRILRTKHSKPIVVDMIDAHPPFQKQWMQRQRYYRKCKYSITETKL